MKNIFLYFSIILLFLSKTQNIFANDRIFTVDNIIIEGKTNQNNYKNNSIDNGFRKGFQKLLASILRSEDQRKIISTDSTTIKSLVQNFKIAEEKIFQDNYVVNMSVSFNEVKISEFFNKKNISYSPSSNLETIIYPILIINSKLQVFSENKFFEEWNKLKEYKDVNFILPVENLDDFDFINQNKENLEETDLSRLVDNYEIKNSAILILRYDKKVLNVFIKTNFKNIKKLKNIKINVKNLEDEKVREETISKLKLIVHDIWKDQNLIDISTPSYLTLNVNLDDAITLKKIIRKIANVKIIKNFYIQEVDKNNTKIKIKYLGKIKSLENALSESGFILQIQNNEWNLTLKG